MKERERMTASCRYCGPDEVPSPLPSDNYFNLSTGSASGRWLVFLDGEPIERVRECVAGENGWVIQCTIDKGGHVPVCRECYEGPGEVVKHGEVVVRYEWKGCEQPIRI